VKRLHPRNLYPADLYPRLLYPGGDQAGYLVFMGEGSPANIDYTTTVAEAPAGQATIDIAGLSLTSWARYWFAVRARSAYGTVEANTDRIVCVVVDDLGALVGPPPNDLTYARGEAAAAGKIDLVYCYRAGGQLVSPSAIEVAPVAAGAADWDNLVDTIAIGGGAEGREELTPTYAHGETVRLACRVITAAGARSRVTYCDPVAADAIGPSAVDYLAVTQAD